MSHALHWSLKYHGALFTGSSAQGWQNLPSKAGDSKSECFGELLFQLSPAEINAGGTAALWDWAFADGSTGIAGAEPCVMD